MPKFILVHSAGGAVDGPVFATALTVARAFSAHLAFLHVHPDVRQEFACVSVEWINETGADYAWVAECARAADMLVAGRTRAGGGRAMDVLEAALMDSGRPVLIAPTQPPASVGRVIAIAWKDTREAAAAVSAALPFIAQAERVIILTVDEGDSEEDRSSERLQRALRWHNPNVLLHRLVNEARSSSETLLRAVGHAEADLLVMGGYGHTRLREAVFGGFTRHVLEHATLPVLMAH
jgi:nucleotide-binding universal stress UspA family protein